MKANRVFIIFLFVFFFLKVILLFKFHSIFWDEAVYLGMGKSFYSSYGLFESFRPIGLGLIVGLFWYLGLPYVFTSSLLILVLSLVVLFMVFLIGKKLFNPSVGVISSLLVLSTGVFFDYSSLIMTDVVSILFVLIGFYFVVSGQIFMGGVLSGIAVYFRFPHLIFIFLSIVYILFFIKNFKHLIEYGRGLVLILIPYFVYNFIYYGSILYPFISAFSHQGNVAESVNGIVFNLFFYFIQMFYGNFLLLFFVVGVILVFKYRRVMDINIQYLLVVLIGYLVYFTFIINKQPRFLIAFLPFVALFAGHGLFVLFKKVKVLKIVFLIVILFLLSINFNNGYSGENIDYNLDYHLFFDSIETDIVFTADPVLAGYVDKEFVPYYFSVPYAHEFIFNLNGGWVVYSRESFFCDDNECFKKLDEIEEFLESKFDLHFNKDLGFRQVRIYYLKSDFKK